MRVEGGGGMHVGGGEQDQVEDEETREGDKEGDGAGKNTSSTSSGEEVVGGTSADR
jgi:hypothetical protein